MSLRRQARQLRRIAAQLDAAAVAPRAVRLDQGSPDRAPRDRHPLQAPDIDVPTRVDEMARPGDDINRIIREATGADHLIVGVEGVHDVGVDLQRRYGGHWDGRDMSIEIVGMSDDAEIRGLSIQEYHEGNVGFLGLYRLAVRNAKGTRAPIWDTAPSGAVTLHDVGLLPDLSSGAGYDGMKWGIKLGDGVDLLHVDSCRRLVDPKTRTLVKFWEHWLYGNDVMQAYICGNNMSGGNRTGMQLRTPGLAGYRHPTGPILIENNTCNDLGRNWYSHNGGYAITVWESRGPLVIRGNEVARPKYGALAVAHQPPDQKPWTVSPQGHVHEQVYIEDNNFDSRGGDRSNAVISSALDVRVVGNSLQADNYELTINGATASKWGAPPCLDVSIADDHRVGQWNGDEYTDWV